MEVIIYIKPGAVTNLIKESCLLRTALLFADVVYAKSPELESLISVYRLEDTASAEHQYGTILDAMPALNPASSVKDMRENLVQIKKLKNNNRKSSREIIALKKAQKQLGQINNTFRIITQTLFDSSNFSSIASLVGKKVFLDYDLVSLNPQSQYLHVLDEDLLEDIPQIDIVNLKDYASGDLDQSILTVSLLKEKDLEQVSIPSILKSHKIIHPAFIALLMALEKSIPKTISDNILSELQAFKVHTENLPLKKAVKKARLKGTETNITMGFCSPQLFGQIVNPFSFEFSIIPLPLGYVPFIFNHAIPPNNSNKAPKQAVLQNQ